MALNARNKGAEGEREFCRFLQKTLNLQNLPERNLDQVRNGGSDVCTVSPFMFEVKRCQVLSLRNWWVQVCTAARNVPGSIPVVAYRQNRGRWMFLLTATMVGLEHGYIIMEEREFTLWIRQYYGIA